MSTGLCLGANMADLNLVTVEFVFSVLYASSYVLFLDSVYIVFRYRNGQLI